MLAELFVQLGLHFLIGTIEEENAVVKRVQTRTNGKMVLCSQNENEILFYTSLQTQPVSVSENKKKTCSIFQDRNKHLRISHSLCVFEKLCEILKLLFNDNIYSRFTFIQHFPVFLGSFPSFPLNRYVRKKDAKFNYKLIKPRV